MSDSLGFTSTDRLAALCNEYGLRTDIRPIMDPPDHDEASFNIDGGYRFCIFDVSSLTMAQWKRIRGVMDEISPQGWVVHLSGDRP